jgi:peptidoglycan hydrolase-like protein with peptidoglycan-binding domain
VVGQHAVWVGELQRMLGNRLGYDIPDRDGDPGHGIAPQWGVYTEGTAGAVKKFQADESLAITGSVDETTWQALQGSGC